MSALVLLYIFLLVGTIIIFMVAAFSSLKIENQEQDKPRVWDNTGVRTTGCSLSNPYIVNPVVKTRSYAIPALQEDRHSEKQLKKAFNKERLDKNNKETYTLTINITLSENNKASKHIVKKTKNHSLVNDVYYKAYNEAESMMTDYNAAQNISNNSADLATFEDGHHFDNYAEDFKQHNDDNESY